MRQSGFRAWKVFGGLTAAALLGLGCGKLPDTGGTRPDDPPAGFLESGKYRERGDFYSRFQYPADRGYNGTIQQLGSSIDPRTPEKAGQQGNSRQVDVTGWSPPASR